MFPCVIREKEELEEITGAKGAQIIFKHNTTCPISKGVLRRLREGEDVLPPNIPFYILDLLTYRSISDAIAKNMMYHINRHSCYL